MVAEKSEMDRWLSEWTVAVNRRLDDMSSAAIRQADKHDAVIEKLDGKIDKIIDKIEGNDKAATMLYVKLYVKMAGLSASVALLMGFIFKYLVK